MRIYIGKNITTATTVNNSHKKLLNALARCTSSTSFQSTITIQPGSRLRAIRGEASNHLASTKDNNAKLEEDIDELEWHRIISTPHVRNGIRRLAADARRQIAAGEIEEGGFAVE